MTPYTHIRYSLIMLILYLFGYFFQLEITLNCDLVFVMYIAFQDRKDDLKAGVKSTAVTFGDTTKYWLSGFGAACIGSLALTGYNANLGWCLASHLLTAIYKFTLD